MVMILYPVISVTSAASGDLTVTDLDANLDAGIVYGTFNRTLRNTTVAWAEDGLASGGLVPVGRRPVPPVQHVAVGADAQFYVLTVPSSLRARFSGAAPSALSQWNADANVA